MSPDYVTASQAAEMLGIGLSTLHHWSRPGGPLQPAMKLAGLRGPKLFLRADVEALIAARAAEAAS